MRVAEPVLDRLNDLDDHQKERVKKKLQEAAGNPDHYLKPLTGHDGYRIRVGDLRVIVK